MARGEIRSGRGVRADAAPARTRSSSGERRLPAPVEHTEAPPQAKRSAAMELAAEVERLERELAAARSQMADLATRADIDPLTDILNRRGFEPELKRSLAHVKRYGSSAALLYLDLHRFKPLHAPPVQSTGAAAPNA